MGKTKQELEQLYNLAVRDSQESDSEEVKIFREFIQNVNFRHHMEEKMRNENEDYIEETF